MANKVSFRDGIEGISRMTSISERLGFNLRSIEGVASSFDSFSNAIENAAKLQVLGGNAAIYGGNPLELMYESLNNAEALTERAVKMFRGMASFNFETRYVRFEGLEPCYGQAICPSSWN